jgi:glycerophosphoryl diester phosphodiesterase
MIHPWIEKSFKRLANALFATLPRPLPNTERLRGCKIVSHRGEHDNRQVFENTLAAFDSVRDGGVWGIELDIRWTKDLQPLVFHDADFRRLFHSSLAVNRMTMAEVKAEFSVIPSLEEVILRYGKELHLMVEIKKEVYPNPDYQIQVLRDLFSQLEPQKDFHVLSLAPEMFEFMDFVPSQTFLPIAEVNVFKLSKMAIKKKYGGMTGHYLFVTDRVKRRHQGIGQKVGTGFANSRNCLFREINRGVDWIFSDKALEMQSIVATNI